MALWHVIYYIMLCYMIFILSQGDTILGKHKGVLEMAVVSVTAHRMEHTYRERKVWLKYYWVYLASDERCKRGLGS